MNTAAADYLARQKTITSCPCCGRMADKKTVKSLGSCAFCAIPRTTLVR